MAKLIPASCIVSFPKIRPFKNRIRQATQERVQ
jgi:hypothetical protein